MPERIQLSRRPGAHKPDGAITVARPTKWGNPFVVGDTIEKYSDLWPWIVVPTDPPGVVRSLQSLTSVRITAAARAVELHAWWILHQPNLMLSLDELAGHDLACWCKPGAPCHADTLIEMANA